MKIILILSLIFAPIGALLAHSRNRTPWKGAICGALPITLLGMIIFLKTKGERTNQKRIIDKIIICTFIFLVIGGAIIRASEKSNFTDTLQKNDNDKIELITWLNSNAEAGITFKSDSEKLIIMASLEVFAKNLKMPYEIAETSFSKESVIGIYTKVMLENMRKTNKKMIPNIKKLGFKYIQASVVYKNGEIVPSTTENIN